MSRKSEARITDIARAAGVSITTVSRILSNDSELKISTATRERVLQTAEQLGYQPNLFAVALRSKRTGIIGALSPNLAGTFLPLLTMELQRAARTSGVELLIGSPEVNPKDIEVQLKKLQSLLFDGLLLLGDVLDYQDTIRKLRILRKPFVSVCAGVDVPAPLVNLDDEAAVRLAVEYLVGLGHRRIAYLGTTQWKQEGNRLARFQQAATHFGLVVQPDHIVIMDNLTYTPFDPTFRERYTTVPLLAVRALLEQPDRPTAIFCANDGFALAALKAALQMGLHVPEHVSILGYNDEIPSTLFHPELTTIRQPLDQIATISLDLLMRMIVEEETEQIMTSRVLVAPELIIRGTCAAPAL